MVVHFAGRRGRGQGGVGFDLGGLADFVPNVSPKASHEVAVTVFTAVGVVSPAHHRLAIAYDVNLFPRSKDRRCDDDRDMLGDHSRLWEVLGGGILNGAMLWCKLHGGARSDCKGVVVGEEAAAIGVNGVSRLPFENCELDFVDIYGAPMWVTRQGSAGGKLLRDGGVELCDTVFGGQFRGH